LPTRDEDKRAYDFKTVQIFIKLYKKLFFSAGIRLKWKKNFQLMLNQQVTRPTKGIYCDLYYYIKLLDTRLSINHDTEHFTDLSKLNFPLVVWF